MNYTELAYLHLATVIPTFLMGTYLLISRKGSPGHKAVGKIYMLLMLITSVISLFMEARVGPVLLGHFGYIHLLSILSIYAVPVAYISAKNGNIKAHRNSMLGLYLGGILIAGTFAFMPGRLLHSWLFGG